MEKIMLFLNTQGTYLVHHTIL